MRRAIAVCHWFLLVISFEDKKQCNTHRASALREASAVVHCTLRHFPDYHLIPWVSRTSSAHKRKGKSARRVMKFQSSHERTLVQADAWLSIRQCPIKEQPHPLTFKVSLTKHGGQLIGAISKIAACSGDTIVLDNPAPWGATMREAVANVASWSRTDSAPKNSTTSWSGKFSCRASLT